MDSCAIRTCDPWLELPSSELKSTADRKATGNPYESLSLSGGGGG